MIVKYFNKELELDIDEFIRKLVNDMSISDDLWERNFKDFDHIYIHMPITIDVFIEMMLKDESNYPFDGYEAERFID